MTPFGARLRALRLARQVTLAQLAKLSHPRVTVNTAGLLPEQTALANRLAQTIHTLSPETIAAMHALLDATAPQPKPRLRRRANSRL